MKTSYVFAADASLEFEPSSISLKKGEQVDVGIIIDTAGNEVAGAGAKIFYDPEFASIVKITQGNIFADYPSASFNNITGNMLLSGIVSSVRNLYTGRGLFGTVTFQGVKEGDTKVKFEFKVGNTTDSNIAVTYGTGDILSKVNELTVNIQSGFVENQIPTIPLTSQEEEIDLSEEEESQGVFSKILTFLGLKDEPQKDSIKPYDPITSQTPNKSPYQAQASRSHQSTTRMSKFLLSIILIVIIVLIIGLIILFRRRKKPKEPGANITNLDY